MSLAVLWEYQFISTTVVLTVLLFHIHGYKTWSGPLQRSFSQTLSWGPLVGGRTVFGENPVLDDLYLQYCNYI